MPSWRAISSFAALAAVAAFVALFLPFTFNTSPFAVIRDDLVGRRVEPLELLAWPFFAVPPAWLLVAAGLRRPPGRGARLGAWFLLAAVAADVAAVLVVASVDDHERAGFGPLLALRAAVAAVVAAFAFLASRGARRAGFAGLTAPLWILALAFLNLAYLVQEFHSGLQAGAWVWIALLAPAALLFGRCGVARPPTPSPA